MFMVTATGTAVKGERISEGISADQPARPVSEIELRLTIDKLRMIQLAEDGKLEWDDKTWSLIGRNRMPDFVSYVLRDFIGLVRGPARFSVEVVRMEQNLVAYLAVLPREAVIEHIYAVIKGDEDFPSAIFDIVKEVKLLDLSRVLGMLRSNDLRAQRRAMRVLYSKKPSYTRTDLDMMVSVTVQISQLFAPTGQVTSKKGLLGGKREMWICENKHENEIDAIHCDDCFCDQYGFRKGEGSPRIILPRLQATIDALGVLLPS